MSSITLSRPEAAFLTAAAGRSDGQVILPETMKPVTAQRLVGKLLKHELVAAGEQDGVSVHHLTPAGYKAVGLTPPRVRRALAAKPDRDTAAPAVEVPSAGTKRDRVIALLGRPEGASLPELIAATGWLPHTTRAVLSRLRSGGQTLEKSAREDGATAYRIVVGEPKPRRRSSRSRTAEAQAQVG